MKIFLFVILVVFAGLFFKNSFFNDNDIVKKENIFIKHTKDLKKQKDVKIHYIEKKKVQKSTNTETEIKKNITLDKENKIDDITRSIIDNGYIASSKKVGDFEVDIVSDVKVEKDENIPPAVPLIISGSIDGKKFTQAVDREQLSRSVFVVIKDNNGNLIEVKEYSADQISNSAVLELPSSLDPVSNVAKSQDKDDLDDTDTQSDAVPPMVPSF